MGFFHLGDAGGETGWVMFPKPERKKQRARRREELREYARRRGDFLRRRPFCRAAVQCRIERVNHEGQTVVYVGLATEVHHMKGRGRFLLDESTWLGVCSACHRHIHENVAWAREHGWVQSRVLDSKTETEDSDE